MYHSVASLLATGAIITAGSNPQGSYADQYDPANGVFPSELRVEYYYPWCEMHHTACASPTLHADRARSRHSSVPHCSVCLAVVNLP